MARARRDPGHATITLPPAPEAEPGDSPATVERKRHPLGRRPLLSDKEVVGKLLAAVAAGASYGDAIEAADISPATFYKWRQRFEAMALEQRRPGNPYFDFFEGLRRAKVRGKVNNIVAIKLDKDWRSKAWLLERQYPNEFGKQQRLEVSGPGGGAVPVRVEIPPRERELELWDGEVEALPEARGGNGHG